MRSTRLTGRASVHRDLKPGNIMLIKSGAKLLDFGLAKLKQDATPVSGLSALATNPSRTAEGTILGTLQYIHRSPVDYSHRQLDSFTEEITRLLQNVILVLRE